jgi:hypothetical protein
MSTQTRIALGTLCVFNVLILMMLGAGVVRFVNGAAGPILASCLWLTASALIVLSRSLCNRTEWTA